MWTDEVKMTHWPGSLKAFHEKITLSTIKHWGGFILLSGSQGKLKL